MWEYQVSHSRLLFRSPKSPASDGQPEQVTNLDLVFDGVAYVSTPSELRGLEVVEAGPAAAAALSSAGKVAKDAKAFSLLSNGEAFFVVARALTVSENDWDIFDSPFEFRSRFRGEG